MDIINANTYEDFCDYVILPEEHKNFTNEFLKKDGVIFCKTDHIDLLFQNIRYSGRKYALLTHHSDHPIDKGRFKSRPACIKKWFSINPEVRHPDLISIPLGVYVHKGRWKDHFSFFDYEWFTENAERLANKPKIKDVVYCQWGMTNGHRNDILGYLDKAGIKYNWIEERLEYREYCEKMSDYQFVISPPGNGPQCHRTWEAMYMGCIPIVVSNPADDAFTDLPMIRVKDYGSPLDVNSWRYYTTAGYKDLTYDLLNSYLENEYKNINKEKLYLSWWIKFIRDSIK